MSCEPRSCGQRWTDGVVYYADNGTVTAYPEGSAVDLEEYIGPLPDKSQGDQTAKIELLRTTLTQQTAEIDRLRIELQETYAGWSGSNSALAEQTAKSDRLQAEWQTEFTAAQQLRSQVEQLEGFNYRSSEALRDLQEDHTAMGHRAEGARSAFLDVIKTLWELRR